MNNFGIFIHTHTHTPSPIQTHTQRARTHTLTNTHTHTSSPTHINTNAHSHQHTRMHKSPTRTYTHYHQHTHERTHSRTHLMSTHLCERAVSRYSWLCSRASSWCLHFSSTERMCFFLQTRGPGSKRGAKALTSHHTRLVSIPAWVRVRVYNLRGLAPTHCFWKMF